MIVAKSRYGYWAAIAGLMFALTPADPIFAQEAPTASGLEEITVTARRREESIQDIRSQ